MVVILQMRTIPREDRQHKLEGSGVPDTVECPYLQDYLKLDCFANEKLPSLVCEPLLFIQSNPYPKLNDNT